MPEGVGGAPGYITLGAVVAGRSRVVIESWALAGDSFEPLGDSEIHFEYRGMEEALARYISSVAGKLVTHMRFNVQGLTDGDREVLGTWTWEGGYVETD